MSKHTKGPWVTQLESPNLVFIKAKGTPTWTVFDECICEIGRKSENKTANAKLIAAAPRMYDALLECEVLVDDYPHVKRLVKEAMAQARGE